MKENKSRVLFLGKKDDVGCLLALKFCQKNFSNLSFYLGEWGDSLPEGAESWEGEFIVSYLSRWVVPERLLKKAKIAAINFHPASPDYPGIGCNNFALYDNSPLYGVTCHHMSGTVDTGKIIAVKRFPVYPSDDVESLLSRTYTFQLILFYEIIEKIFNNEALPEADENWTRSPYSRIEFNELGRLTLDMSEDEIAKRVRATSFGQWQPTIEFKGYRFKLKP